MRPIRVRPLGKSNVVALNRVRLDERRSTQQFRVRPDAVIDVHGQNPNAEITRKTSVMFTTPSPETSSSHTGLQADTHVDASP